MHQEKLVDTLLGHEKPLFRTHQATKTSIQRSLRR
jgi:hypothetical protein